MAPWPAKVRLVLGVHSHQPLGNFDDVVQRALTQAYDPWLDALERHPGIKTALHYTGCLYEWLEAHAPRHLDKVACLARAGRIEILSGGFYEPILPLIPRTDGVGQIRLLSRYIQSRFGQTPRGMWLAERVWEPTLPGTLREAGIDYTLLDDFHFLTSLDGDPVGGYYVTEDQGDVVKLFPISERMRYLIPFREPAETIAWLKELAERTPAGLEPVAVMVDDGEKFGLWPGTQAWVHGQGGEEGRAGWLERFFTALEENAAWISTTTPSEVLAGVEPRGRVYLPPASYLEMGEWSLPTARGRAFMAAVARAKDRHTWADEKPFLRGGYFRNFQSRYPESLMMVRRAQMLSGRMDASVAKAAAARDGLPDAPRRELWRAMCNCSYWHGVFGGLYLPHIRRAVGEHLCRARRLLEAESHGSSDGRPASRLVDADADGHDEIEIRSAELELLVEPERGGAITVLDLVRHDFPLGLTLTRRVEFYHEEMLHAETVGAPEDAAGGHASIHDIVGQATEEMKRLAVADDRQRASAVDRFLDPAERAEGRRFDPPGEVGDFYNARYEASLLPEGESAGAVMRRTGIAAGREVRLTKTIRVGPQAGRLELVHVIEPGAKDAAAADAMFALEFNLALIETMGRVVLGAVGADPGAEPGEANAVPGSRPPPRSLSQSWASKAVGRLRVEDDYAGFALNFVVEPEAEVWHYPVRTVSRSEQGYEAIYQGSALLLVWPGLGSLPGRTRVVIEIDHKA